MVLTGLLYGFAKNGDGLSNKYEFYPATKVCYKRCIFVMKTKTLPDCKPGSVVTYELCYIVFVYFRGVYPEAWH